MQPEVSLRRQKIEAYFLRQPQTSEAIVEAAIMFWGRLAAPLSRMVSLLGVASLFERCVDLNNSEFPWLPKSRTLYSPEDSICQVVWNSLLAQPHPDALKASVHLFSTLFDLLTALIGERLTARVFSLSFPDGSDNNLIAGDPE